MQRQTNMLNLFVEFRFQLFNMKTLFHFKTRNITLIPNLLEALRCLKMSEFLSPKEMLVLISISSAIGKKKPEKSEGFNGTSVNTGAMLYQLSYEATPRGGVLDQCLGTGVPPRV